VKLNNESAMSEAITIRPAAEGDVTVILQFIRDLAKYEHLEHQVVVTEGLLREALFGSRPYAEVVLACLNGEPVGFALFFHNFSTFLGRAGIYLEDLYVRPEARGHGVGRRLLAWLAATAVSRGCGRLEWSVLDWNEPSIRFYRNLGAVALDDWTLYRVTGPALSQLAAAIG
jgi:GNAT superfamily N-acetyltransferase